MTAWYILPEIDQICLDCHLSRCNESDPRCPRHLALAAGDVCRKKPILREIKVLDHLKRHPGWHRIADVARAVGAPSRSILYTLKKLSSENQIARTGYGHTLRLRALAGRASKPLSEEHSKR